MRQVNLFTSVWTFSSHKYISSFSESVINQTQVNCTEAAIALALTYFRSEAHVDVYKYTPMQTVLEKLNWAQGISYDDAQAICMSNQVGSVQSSLFTQEMIFICTICSHPRTLNAFSYRSGMR